MRRTTHALLTLMATALALCTPAADPTAAPDAAITYRLAWDLSGVTVSDAGWTVTTDLGTAVSVTRGYLTTYSMELVECPAEIAEWGLGEGTAHAGHDAVQNPIALPAPVVEALTAPVERDAAVVDATGLTYCQAHWLVARTPAGTHGLPEDVDMTRTSLHIEGTWQRPGDAEPTAFLVHTTLANGTLADLAGPDGAALRLDTTQAGATVTATRALGPLFDGIDFAAMSASDVERQLLTNLIAHTALSTTIGGTP